jgi:hypothetical protein
MTENKSNNFNTEPLLKEIENVINNGLHKILNEYVDKYNLMEKTHKQILQLATGVSVETPNNFNIVNTSLKNTEINNTSQVQSNDELDKLQVKFDKLEKVIFPHLDYILRTLRTLTSEINSIKSLSNLNPNEITNENKQTLKNASVLTSEKENIQLEIIEESEENESEELESEEEEVEEVKEEMVKKEVIVIEDDDDADDSDEEEEVEEVKKVVVIKEEKVTEKVAEKVVVIKKETDVKETDVKEIDDDVDTEEEEEVEKEVEEEEVEEEEEEEFLEIDIDDITYCTNNEENGFIYELKEDGDVGNKVGYLKEGEPFFYADEK